jgi:hypothetical protein
MRSARRTERVPVVFCTFGFPISGNMKSNEVQQAAIVKSSCVMKVAYASAGAATALSYHVHCATVAHAME